MDDIHESSKGWRVQIQEAQNLTDLIILQKQFDEEGIEQCAPYEVPAILNAFDSRKKELAKK